MSFAKIIARETSLNEVRIANTLKLLDEGATIPFISRYRKEATGGMDEVQIETIAERYSKLEELEARKKTIVAQIEQQGKMTAELRKQIDETWDAALLEDIYLPYKPKRKTRATKARELGLEPLAKRIMSSACRDAEAEAQKFLTDEVQTTEAAVQGAKDIIAEWVAEKQEVREMVRVVFRRSGHIMSSTAKGKESEAEKYSNYAEFDEKLSRCPSHRLLAMMRAAKEGVLRVKIEPEEPDAILQRLNKWFATNRNTADIVGDALSDSYKRLLAPAMETEMLQELKQRADTEAIAVFQSNLRQLLLAAPLGGKRVLALDPGLRTGCKVVCLDENGNMLHHSVVFPHPPKSDSVGAERELKSLVKRYGLEAVAIGNGTASRETENFVRNMKTDKPLKVFVVSEDGASIYSASATAREEFPDEDVTVRGAVSIGRRLMDPLAELVKIDPKSLGVGQYQHDVDQGRLKQALDAVVVSCVNQVGVDVNTASKHLLTYVSGLGPQLAQNIVDFRSANGAFSTRSDFKKVPRLGAKAFEQCAGFLRINGGKNPLDATAVHPESYHIVKQMADDAKCTIAQLMADPGLRRKVDLGKYVTAEVGLPTLNDIMEELGKPGRDPRETLEEFAFSDTVHSIEDLEAGMVLPGIVTNITNFGAFVDLGVKVKGLVHVSQVSETYVKDIAEAIKLHQHVYVKVLDVDTKAQRISLSMKGVPQH